MEDDLIFTRWLDEQSKKLKQSRNKDKVKRVCNWADTRSPDVPIDLIDLYSDEDSEEELYTVSMSHDSSASPKDKDYYRTVWREGENLHGGGEPTARQQVAKILKETQDFSQTERTPSNESGFVDALTAQYSPNEPVPQRDVEKDLDWEMEVSSVDGDIDAASVDSDNAVRIRGLGGSSKRAPPPPELEERPLDDEEIDMFMEEMDRIASGSSVYKPKTNSNKQPIFTGRGSYRRMEPDRRLPNDDEMIVMGNREPMERDDLPIVDQESLRFKFYKRRVLLKRLGLVLAIIVLIIVFILTTVFVVKGLQS